MEELTSGEIREVLITALAVIALLQRFAAWRKKRKKEKALKAEREKHKFTPKVWTPDGWYYDEKKQKWIGPDYPQSKEKEEC